MERAPAILEVRRSFGATKSEENGEEGQDLLKVIDELEMQPPDFGDASTVAT